MVLPRSSLSCAGLFAGIAGAEVGLAKAGHEILFFCEIDDAASSVLSSRFPGVALQRDVRTLEELPPVDLVVAGFPCQDLSQAGRTAGIGGRQSGLIEHVFRLLRRRSPRWVLLENVPFMLSLDRGQAMRYLTTELARLKYAWAYRVVNSRAFGLPQRRKRVILLASRTEDPWDVVLADEAEPAEDPPHDGVACGFYWTEGVRGLGWAVDSVPTLKGGSTVGIPSPPAIWMPSGEIVTPDIRDAERMQGFLANWTLPARGIGSRGERARWKLIGNAVSPPVLAWVGERLNNPGNYDRSRDPRINSAGAWPNAAWGALGHAHVARRGSWPVRRSCKPLAEFLQYPTKPLSRRATAGFLDRTHTSSLRFPKGFLDAVQLHHRRMQHTETGATVA
jgi:DNA (cytosine-5)-methyltransferase 1